MPTHLSSIGFPVLNEQDLYTLAKRASQKAKPFAVEQGYYLKYLDPSGACLWLHADGERQITGMNPHFIGPSVMKLKIIRSMHKPEGHAFEGAYFAWVIPERTLQDQADSMQEGAYPLLFDAPDYLRHSAESFPKILNVQLAAFAHEIQLYESAAEFHEKDLSQPKIAAEAFVPAGLFSAPGESAAVPTAHARINGRILDAQKRSNQLSGSTFWWVQLQSYAGVYDAVIDPVLLAGDPKPGGVIAGTFWLSGLILDETTAHRLQSGFLRLLRSMR